MLNNRPIVVFYNSQHFPHVMLCQPPFYGSLIWDTPNFLWHAKYEWGLRTRLQRAWHCFWNLEADYSSSNVPSVFSLFYSLLMHSASFLLIVMAPLLQKMPYQRRAYMARYFPLYFLYVGTFCAHIFSAPVPTPTDYAQHCTRKVSPPYPSTFQP